LDQAIADISKTGAFPGQFDLFYKVSSASTKARWVTLAKTLKLRAYMTTRLVDPSAKSKIEALLAENDLIDQSSGSEDFEFKYSSKQTNPNSRHPWYNGNYNASGGSGDYIGTYFMWALIKEKQGFSNNIANDKSDPRTRYYLYRQQITYSQVNQATSSCSVETPPAHYPATMPFCLPGSGFWGRDHGDASGIPPDGELRTTVGIYPSGGDLDYNQGKTVTLNQGGLGAGIQPIWQSAFTDFLKAEAALTLGTPGDPRALLVSAINKSFAKVIGFPATIGVSMPAAYVPTETRKTDYINFVLAKYDAGTAEEKLDIIMKEYYLALWGNGVDAYNNYRRTGKPGNMQFTKTPNPGAFISSVFYPSVYVNRNLNATQKSVDVHVFWDTNPPGFNK
ncbi:MAG: SusD/RagB family nutrient-binding outer membrane lipoprotein, partial [Microcystis sp.]